MMMMMMISMTIMMTMIIMLLMVTKMTVITIMMKMMIMRRRRKRKPKMLIMNSDFLTITLINILRLVFGKNFGIIHFFTSAKMPKHNDIHFRRQF